MLGCLKNVSAYFDSDKQSSFLEYDTSKFLNRKSAHKYISALSPIQGASLH